MGITVFEFFWSTNLSKILQKRNVNTKFEEKFDKMSNSIALLYYNTVYIAFKGPRIGAQVMVQGLGLTMVVILISHFSYRNSLMT